MSKKKIVKEHTLQVTYPSLEKAQVAFGILTALADHFGLRFVEWCVSKGKTYTRSK